MARLLVCYLLVSAAYAQTPEAGIRIRSGIFAPKLITKIDPSYTEEAERARAVGTVVLACVVGANGQLHEIKIRQPMGLGLDEKAIEALNKWTFQPGSKDGKPVSVFVVVEMNFGHAQNDQRWQIRRLVFHANATGRPVLKHSPRPDALLVAPGTRVIIHLKVDSKGKVTNAVAESGASSGIATPLVNAVLEWQFMMPEHPDPSGYEAELELSHIEGK